MYTVPWIINNMIMQPTEMTKLRRPSEVELKVQKSLQQLTVPDWYANKCVASPKIISDRRPFESRPAPWKDPTRIRPPSKNAMTNSDIVKPAVENHVASSKFEKYSEVAKVSSLKSPSYTSKTFPKISPSRKIQNINIVFPMTTTSPETPVKSTNDGVSSRRDPLDNSIMSIDSLEQFTPQKMSTLENETKSVTASTPIKDSPVRTLAFQRTPRTLRMNCPPPAVPTTPPRGLNRESLNFRDESFLTPKKLADTEKILISPRNKFADTELSTPEKMAKNTNINYSSLPAPSTPARIWNKNLSDLLDQSLNEETLFLTPKKSTEMEKIIKNQQKRSSGKSFVEEIIQELNAKCSPKVKSSYVSPTSKNFVKKLVRALEMGYAPERENENETCESFSDNEYKSRPSSASNSMKDSDSGSGSDSEVKSSASNTSRDSAFRSFSRALEDRGKLSRESVIPYVDDEDESVYWIPLPNCKLPRTSSLKNMMSRLSSNSEKSLPISSSPGSDNVGEPPLTWQPTNLQNSNISGWGKTFDRKQIRSRQLFRIDETTVMDSGYSDRSGTNSESSSVIDESWYDDSETTQTASEIGEEFENAYSTQAPPRRLPGNRQRTFVV